MPSYQLSLNSRDVEKVFAFRRKKTEVSELPVIRSFVAQHLISSKEALSFYVFAKRRRPNELETWLEQNQKVIITLLKLNVFTKKILILRYLAMGDFINRLNNILKFQHDVYAFFKLIDRAVSRSDSIEYTPIFIHYLMLKKWRRQGLLRDILKLVHSVSVQNLIHDHIVSLNQLLDATFLAKDSLRYPTVITLLTNQALYFNDLNHLSYYQRELIRQPRIDRIVSLGLTSILKVVELDAAQWLYASANELEHKLRFRFPIRIDKPITHNTLPNLTFRQPLRPKTFMITHFSLPEPVTTDNSVLIVADSDQKNGCDIQHFFAMKNQPVYEPLVKIKKGSEVQNSLSETQFTSNQFNPPQSSDEDLGALEKFCAFHQGRLHSTRALKSLNQFQEAAKRILVSKRLSPQQKRDALNDCAAKEFKHRHFLPRLLADSLLLISSFILVGVAVGLVRVLTGHHFFFSTKKTLRETHFNEVADKLKLNDSSGLS